MRIVYCFILGSVCMVFALTMLFEVVEVNDILRYCEVNNLMLIDKLCGQEVFDYGMNLFVSGIWLSAAGMVLIFSVLVAPDLSNFGQGMKV